MMESSASRSIQGRNRAVVQQPSGIAHFTLPGMLRVQNRVRAGYVLRGQAMEASASQVPLTLPQTEIEIDETPLSRGAASSVVHCVDN